MGITCKVKMELISISIFHSVEFKSYQNHFPCHKNDENLQKSMKRREINEDNFDDTFGKSSNIGKKCEENDKIACESFRSNCFVNKSK